MKRNFHILLAICIFLIFQIAFWIFTLIGYQNLSKGLINQVKADNQSIALQLVTVLSKTGLTTENPETDSILQQICDQTKMPNGGFICVVNRQGNMVAAPGLMPGMTMKFHPILSSFNDELKSISPNDLKQDTLFEGYAFFTGEKRLDVVESVQFGKDLRIFVHQNNTLIKQKAWDAVKPLVFIGIFISLMLVLLLYFIFKRVDNQYQNKIKQQNEEIHTTFNDIKKKEIEIEVLKSRLEKGKNELDEKNQKILEQSKEITDSINYAHRIQKSALPKTTIDESIASEHFILFIPRDVVSGDFYWYHSFDDVMIITVVDCTGHGVPGALMSMIGVSFLNEIVIEEGNRKPGSILDQMRKRVMNALRQEYGKNSATDGMNMSLCIIEKQTYKMQFAGAYHPAVVIRNDELFEIKGDKMPVGIHGKMDEHFTNHEIQLLSGDFVYLFSDGFADQFGGSKGRKFMTRNFLSLLLEIKDLPIQEQKNVLEQTIMEWKGNYSQVDDITVIGLKIN